MPVATLKRLLMLLLLAPGAVLAADALGFDAARHFLNGEFVFRRQAHDDDPKTVFGRSGNFDGDAVLDILLAQPQTAEFIVSKLWREFVSPSPDPADHGTANAHFVLGGRVKGGIYGPPPALTRLDGNGNLPFAVDFRDLYATALERWWGIDSSVALNGRFAPVDVLKA